MDIGQRIKYAAQFFRIPKGCNLYETRPLVRVLSKPLTFPLRIVYIIVERIHRCLAYLLHANFQRVLLGP